MQACSVDGCERSARSVRSGLCGTHYQRLRTSGRLDIKSAEERFWQYVDKGDSGTDCWLWNMRLDTNGYARLWVKPNTVLAHRFAYEMLIGPIPDGLTLDHVCRVRHCVNPAHLIPTTLSENVRRAHSANGSKTLCPKGHNLDVVNSGDRRECSICKRDRANTYARRVKAADRFGIPRGIITIEDLVAYVLANYRDEVDRQLNC